MNELYKVLGVSSDISDADLTKKYNSLIRKFDIDSKALVKDKQYVEIQDAYDEIMRYRKNLSYGTGASKFEEFYDVDENNRFTDISIVPIIDTKGKFIEHKAYNNEFIPETKIEYIDGYAQVTTGCKSIFDDYQLNLQDPEEEYKYNYISNEGKFLFDNDEASFFHYIGRNIFVSTYTDDTWYLMSPIKEKVSVQLENLEYASIYSKENFINFLVSELNKKYLLEVNGLKYKFRRGKDWYSTYSKFALRDPKKIIETFINAISEYDTTSREVYYDAELYLSDGTAVRKGRSIFKFINSKI